MDAQRTWQRFPGQSLPIRREPSPCHRETLKAAGFLPPGPWLLFLLRDSPRSAATYGPTQTAPRILVMQSVGHFRNPRGRLP